MWRYLAGGGAALLVAASLFFFRSSATAEKPVLPPAPPAPGFGQQVETGGASPPVPEASARTREEKRFDRYDKDRNQSVGKEEYLASRRKAFAKLDMNHDGRLSFEEWAAKTLGKFDRADADKSGSLSRAEFATTAVKRKAASRPRCVCPSAKPPANEEASAEE